MRPYRPGDPVDPALPSGIVQRTIGWGLKARWELPRNSWVEGAFFRGRVSNIDHVRGDSDTSNAFRLAVRFDF